MSVTVTTKRYHKVKKERDDAQTKMDELSKELEQWQEKYENMEQERDAARMRQQELTKELRKLKGLSERETPLEAGSFKEEAGKHVPWLVGWRVKQLAAISMECLHQGQRSHDTTGSKASLVGLKAKPLEITVVNLSKLTKLEMASSYFHSGKFESEPVGFIEPGESHTYNVSSRDGRSKTGVKGGISFAVSDLEGLEEEEANEPAKEETTAEEEKEQAEEKVENKEADQKNAENGEVVKENKELDEDKELEKFDPPNGEKKESEKEKEKKKKRFSLKREKKHKHDHSEKEEKADAPAEEGEKAEEPAAEAAPEEQATEETKEEDAKEEATEETPAEEEKPAEGAGKDEADSTEKKPKEKKKAKFSLRKSKKSKENKAVEPDAPQEEEQPAEEPKDQADNAETAEATEEKEPEAVPEQTEEAEVPGPEEKPEVVSNGTFFVCAFENPLAGIQKAKSSKTQSKDVIPVLKKMKSGSPSKQPYGGHYKDAKRHFVYIWKDPELGW